MPFLGFVKFISPRGWLAIGGAVAVALVAALFLAWLGARDTARDLRAQLNGCSQRSAALEKQIKIAADQGGKDYEQTEASHLSACRAAYDAGAKRLRDDQAVAAGRYVPGRGSSTPSR